MGKISKIIKSVCFAVVPLAAACTQPQGNVLHTMHGAQVHRLEDARFEVVPEIGAVRDAYWCAAGEYARRAGGADWGDRVYVARDLGRGEAVDRKSTVVFSLVPVAGAEPQPWLMRVNRFRPGDYLTVQSAERRCENLRPFVWSAT